MGVLCLLVAQRWYIQSIQSCTMCKDAKRDLAENIIDFLFLCLNKLETKIFGMCRTRSGITKPKVPLNFKFLFQQKLIICIFIKQILFKKLVI
jgi:hypothetical protein